MNYETAKKLKEAGYIGSENWEDIGGVFKSPTPTPNLSEIIEVCGDGFHSLERYENGERWRCVEWISNIYECSDGIARKACTWKGNIWGFTPEEAVANLWLELNKKES